jgi:hypothetical protein
MSHRQSLISSDFSNQTNEALLERTTGASRFSLTVANSPSVEILSKPYNLVSNAEEAR